jgi:hypothetical protein
MHSNHKCKPEEAELVAKGNQVRQVRLEKKETMKQLV